MSEPKSYLCLGGPAHGKRYALLPGARELKVMRYDRQFIGTFLGQPLHDILPTTETYQVKRLFILGEAVSEVLVHESLINKPLRILVA